MVRLKVYVRSDFDRIISGFNSNMVRLKAVTVIGVVPHVVPFQFQYGTIKSISDVIGLTGALGFQFQYGTIKSVVNVDGYKLPKMFQFQYGTIKRCRGA